MFKGVTFGFYARNGYFSSPVGLAEARKIVDLGTKWVCLVSTVLQDAYYSTRQYRDFRITPGDHELVATIKFFRENGVKVMLRPMIECWDGGQRCDIKFPDDREVIPGKRRHYVADWFESYADLTRHYGRMAEETGCESYGLDSELNDLMGYNDEWLKVIQVARSVYRGHLTTSLISTERHLGIFDQFPENCWFWALDSIGTSMYAPAADRAGTSVDEMAVFLKPAVEKCRQFAERYGKMFYFGEAGCCATAGAAKLPYFWKNGGGYDGEEQARYMAALIKAFGAESWWEGMFWWKWEEQNDRPQFRDDPAGDKGFTIDGKPAATVFANWCRA